MTAAPEDRKIRRLTDDVLAIYEKLDTITDTQRHQGDRLDEVSTQVRRLAAIVDRQGNRLDELAATQDGHTATLAGHGTKLDRILEILERR
ncbi:hypothetical protein [Pseudonocardia sp. DLS-67]